jgi:hypothetical protein
MPPTPPEISFDYIKSNLFRVVYVTGAFGGLDAQARTIHMAVFNERRPIAQTTVQPVLPDGTLGPEKKEKRKSRSALVREVEADLVMDAQTAAALRQWLDDQLVQLTKLTQAKMNPTEETSNVQS